MRRVFFDASIIVAAFLSPTGGSSLLFQYIKSGQIVGVTSQTVIAEVLEEDKPTKFKRKKEEIEQFIADSGLIVRETIATEDMAHYHTLIDPEDAHLIAGATLTKCTYLVSLDKKHVLANDVRKRFLPLMIATPGELIEELSS